VHLAVPALVVDGLELRRVVKEALLFPFYGAPKCASHVPRAGSRPFGNDKV
jgi:hypothetical protein